jgi:hypothetical protein
MTAGLPPTLENFSDADRRNNPEKNVKDCN